MTLAEKIKQMEQLRKAMQFVGETFTDAQALEASAIYPTWDELCKKNFTAENAGYRFRYGNELYKTKTANYTFQSQWIPGVGTESIFERIDVTHTGTASDPIPYDGNMELQNGKYYTQDSVLYLCIRDTGTAVYHALADLVGLYVEVAT